MHEIIKRLHEERIRLVGEQRSLVDAAEAEKRELTAEESEGFDKRDAEIQRIDARVADLRDREQRDREAEEAFRSLLEKAPERRDVEPGDRQAEVRDWLSGKSGRVLEVRADRPVGTEELRVLSKLSAGAGANAVPTSFYDRLMAHLIEVSGILQAGPMLLTTSSGEPLEVPTTTAHSSAALTTEGSAIGASDPVFGKVTMNAYKYGVLMQVSSELAQDTAVDLVGYLAQQAGRAVGNAFGAHAITGTGTGQPQGVAAGATVGLTGATGVAGAFTADNLIDLYHSVISPYRASQSCSWMMRDVTLGAVRKLKDSQGQYLWQPSLQPGTPDLLLGKPVRTDPNVAAVALNARSVLFGDFAAYGVRMVNGIRFERSDEFAFSSDLITYRCLIRADGRLVDTTGAVKAFVGGAS